MTGSGVGSDGDRWVVDGVLLDIDGVIATSWRPLPAPADRMRVEPTRLMICTPKYSPRRYSGSSA